MPNIGYLIVVVLVVAVVGIVWLLRRRSGVDNDVPAFVPSELSTSPFRLTIQDTFTIKGRGLVVTGRVESGVLAIGQMVQLASPDGSEHYDAKVTGLEAFHRQIAQAQTGDNVGVMLSGFSKDQVKPGMIMTISP